jgi:hypothetical protein
MKNHIYPKLKFTYSKRKDSEIFAGFLETNKHFDVNAELEIGFYKLYPELKKAGLNDEKLKLAEKLIDEKFRNNETIITKRVKIIRKQWRKIAPWFYKKCNLIFENHKWPKGKYIAYMTIWGTYPRFLNDKTFSFPYKHKIRKYPLVVIVHEMLHFIFYDYLYKNYPKYKNKKFEKQVWQMSEIFNVLIQNSKKWRNKFKQKVIIYSKLISKIKRMGKKLPANFTARDFIKNWKNEKY